MLEMDQWKQRSRRHVVKQLFNVSIRASAEQIPDKPPELLQELQPGGNVESTARQIQKYMLETRPIVTPRVLRNVIGFDTEDEFYEALPYCGYSFREGPWAKTLVAFGIDPRSDPQYRMFHTFHFELTYDIFLFPGYTQIPKPFYGDLDKESHLFDGKSFIPDSKTWQYCDICDGQLKRILPTTKLKDEFSVKSGFFHPATVAKLEVVMEDKLIALKDGETSDDDLYESLLEFDSEYEYQRNDLRSHAVDPKHPRRRELMYLQRLIIDKCKL